MDYIYIYIYIYIYEMHTISFPTGFVRAFKIVIDSSKIHYVIAIHLILLLYIL